MLLHVARFEMRYLLRNPLLWITAALTFALFFVSMSPEGLELGSEGGLLRNAAVAVVQSHLVTSIAFMFVTTAFVANAVIRDDETGFGPIVRATPLRTSDYLLGRYLGAVTVAALCLLAVPLGMWLGAIMPWADPATLGPTRLRDHAFGYLAIGLPNIIVHSAVFFALATMTRSMMATYLGVIGFASGSFVLDAAFADRPRLVTAVALADPFGGRALADATRYWTVAERNVALPELGGTLLCNRLLWIGIAILLLAVAHRAFRFAEPRPVRARRGWRRDWRWPRRSPAAGNVLAMRTRFEAQQVLFSPAFPVLMAWGLFTTLISLTTQRDPDGRPTYPTTLSLIPELENGLGVVPVIIAIYYAGELVWRERDRRMHELVDASPMPSWVHVVSKTFAMAIVLIAMLVATVVAAVAVQLSLGFTDLEVGKYLLWYVLPAGWDMLLLAALAIFVQALSPHKAIGWGVMVLLLLAQQLGTGMDHNLLQYGGRPSMPLSDMNGAGSFWIGAWAFRLYWGAFAFLLLLAAHLLWRRGTELRLAPRLADGWRRLAGPAGRVAAAALVLLAATGGWAWYNTNVLNAYEPADVLEARLADYERKYGRYADLPQPMVTGVTLGVALHPAERRAVTHGRFVLRNLTADTIPEVHVRMLGDGLQLVRAAMDGARLVHTDSVHDHHVFRLDRAMMPGDERVLAFETQLHLRGFRNEPTNTRVVENGTFLNEGQLTPRIGAIRAGTLQDPAKRRKHGLPEVPAIPKLEDTAAAARPVAGRAWARTDITVSTSADQVPIAPGSVVSDVVRGGRRTVRFVSAAPIQPRFSIQSGRYAERRRRHAGVELVVYHHPAHAWNVDRMLDALAAGVDYYQEHFGPYPFGHARIVEFPGYVGFAQAFAGTIPYSETVGFIADYDEPQAIDYVTYLTAHELAHQYWAHQVIGAEMEGRELLSETLAQYSAQMVVKRMRGETHIRRYLRFELDRYLEGRAGSPLAEPALVRVAGQDHLSYRKGALAMYLLQERIGEEAINRALRALLAKYGFRDAPYPRSVDLVQALRAEAAPAHQALITDLFERVALYDLRVASPAAVRRTDGRWDVTVAVEARKRYVEGGAEVEAPVDERIEIGLFTADPARDDFGPAHVVRFEREAIRSGRQVLRFVTDRRPTHAGIDPYHFYVDRNPADNLAVVR